MSRKKLNPGDRKKKPLPPIKIPLAFDKVVDGLLGLSPEDAKGVPGEGQAWQWQGQVMQ